MQPPSPEYTDVDEFGLPLGVFGDGRWPSFFEVIGRIVAVNGKIEYLYDRLNHLPNSETDGRKKVAQFRTRYAASRDDRNGIVHSMWSFGVYTDGSDRVLGIRYKVGKKDTGDVPEVSIRDVPDSGHRQPSVDYSLDELKQLLRRDIATMQIGQIAHTQVLWQWADDQDLSVGQ